MTHKLNSPAARAKLKAYIEAEKPKKVRMPKEIVHDIKTKADFAGWCAQFPGPAKLFGMIVRRWGGSTATAPASKGKWAAYTYREWCETTGVGSEATLKRHLDRIEEAGLIERALHRHGGTAVKSFLRPTPLGLAVANAKPEDWERLGISAPTADSASGQMEHAYRVAYLASTGHPLVTISKAERAAMRAILKDLPDLAIGIVEAAIADWMAFGEKVKDDASLPDFPSKPSVLFVRKHLQSAVEFLTNAKNAAAKTPKDGFETPENPFPD